MGHLRTYIGDKKFYKMILAIAVPIMIQNGVTNLVSLLDNFMVGRLGTNQMSSVSIINQLIFVFNLAVFGGVSGAGIFSAQYWGQRNHKGVRDSFRFKLIICSVICLVSIGLFTFCDTSLISLYLHGNNDPKDIQATLMYGREYLKVMMIGFIPFIISQAYGSTLREVGETVIPMIASIAAVIVNSCLNILLIFGLLGFPKLGVVGAATATVISRFVEAFIIVIWTHYHHKKFQFIQGVYHNFHVPLYLVKNILIKGTPILLNETLWAAAMAALNTCYAARGLTVVAGLSISTTIVNLFNIVFISMGNAVSIIVGPLLGAGKMKEAKETAYKIIVFSVTLCLGVGTVLFFIAPLFPAVYNTSQEVKTLAAYFIKVSAICMPMTAYLNAAYFTIRSGGKTVITFLFDSVYLLVLTVPVAYLLAHYTNLNIFILYGVCQMLDLIKCVIGYIMLKKDIWIQNIVSEG